jgi:glucose-1-phosphate thymidylyltransferase
LDLLRDGRSLEIKEMITKAVILARGLGTRMRESKGETNLTCEQSDIAKLGVKGLIPISENRTFLDVILERLRTSGFTEICLIIGEEHEILKGFCRKNNLHFAIQKEPLGTSDAVFAAREFAGDDNFLVVNSDNIYPIKALEELQKLDSAGLIAFEKESLIRESNISNEKINKFAVVEIDESGNLIKIVEKPENLGGGAVFVSMNAWVFTSKLFEACRKIEPSSRGEFEIASAVQFAIDELGEELQAIKFRGGVLDLSSREDIEGVVKRLATDEEEQV